MYWVSKPLGDAMKKFLSNWVFCATICSTFALALALGVIGMGTGSEQVLFSHGLTPPPKVGDGGDFAHGLTPPPKVGDGGDFAHGLTPPPKVGDGGDFEIAHGLTPPPKVGDGGDFQIAHGLTPPPKVGDGGDFAA